MYFKFMTACDEGMYTTHFKKKTCQFQLTQLQTDSVSPSFDREMNGNTSRRDWLQNYPCDAILFGRFGRSTARYDSLFYSHESERVTVPLHAA